MWFLLTWQQRLIIDKWGILVSDMLGEFLIVFLPKVATCWFGNYETSETAMTDIPQLYNEKDNIIVLWKINEPVLKKKTSIFDGMCRVCSVAHALTLVMYWGEDALGEFSASVRYTVCSATWRQSCLKVRWNIIVPGRLFFVSGET